MGRPKKTKIEPKAPKKCVVTKYKMRIGAQSKVFNDQYEAKQAAIKVLESGQVYFLSLEEIKEEGC